MTKVGLGTLNLYFSQRTGEFPQSTVFFAADAPDYYSHRAFSTLIEEIESFID